MLHGIDINRFSLLFIGLRLLLESSYNSRHIFVGLFRNEFNTLDEANRLYHVILGEPLSDHSLSLFSSFFSQGIQVLLFFLWGFFLYLLLVLTFVLKLYCFRGHTFFLNLNTRNFFNNLRTLWNFLWFLLLFNYLIPLSFKSLK